MAVYKRIATKMISSASDSVIVWNGLKKELTFIFLGYQPENRLFSLTASGDLTAFGAYYLSRISITVPNSVSKNRD
jgi:hypothetical protein